MKSEKILDKIWKNQQEFNEKIMGKEYAQLNTAERQKWTKELILHLHSETDELLREIAWKIHRQEGTRIILSNLHEELIDIFKYWLSIALVWHLSPEQLLKEYYRKSAVVEQRYQQEQELFRKNGRKVVGVDIDGTLFDYPNSFLDYIEKQTKVDLSKYRQVTDPDLYATLGQVFGFGRLLELKDGYRQSGRKRYGYLVNGAKEFLDTLKRNKFVVILLTARPYKQYRRIYADTLEWLGKNNLAYDGIIWNERKNEVVYQEFPNLMFLVEDMASKAKSVAEIGCKVYLLDRSYNQCAPVKNVIRVKNLEEILHREGLQ